MQLYQPGICQCLGLGEEDRQLDIETRVARPLLELLPTIQDGQDSHSGNLCWLSTFCLTRSLHQALFDDGNFHLGQNTLG